MNPHIKKDISTGIASLCYQAHNQSREAGWYNDPQTGEALERNIPEMLCLIHSEVSEGMEGYRKNLPDDKLPHHQMLTVELADAVIRICDLAEFLHLPLADALVEKLLFNQKREDHKLENRAKEGGKKF